MTLFVVVTCWWIGVAAAGVDDGRDEVESLTVFEGANLTLSIRLEGSDADPQVLVTKGSSRELIAQMICHSGTCALELGTAGVSLTYTGQNVTLILMHVGYNQTGLYTVSTLSSAQPDRTYNITVYKSPLSAISPALPPSAMASGSFTAGLTSAAVFILLLIAAAIAIAVIYRKRRKATFAKVQQDDDSAASSRSGSISVINI